jgi:ribonucleotide reductase alpha subunit
VQHIPEIPQNLKELYKTAWEISQKVIIEMAADRGAYICQSQSLNIFMENVNFGKLTSMHFYSWKAGLKTGMYYLRTKAATDAIKFTLDKSKLSAPKETVGSSGVENHKAVPAESGVPVGSTVTLEPVMTAPTTLSGRAESRPSAQPVSSPANDVPEVSMERQNQERLAALRAESERQQAQDQIACSLDNPEGCEMCSG